MDVLRLRIARLVSRIVRWAVIEGGGDVDPYPTQKIRYMGKTTNSQAWYPYGFNANAPNGALSLLFAIGGDTGHAVHLPGSPQDRVKVAPGEVVMYHPKTGAKVHMKASGDIEVDSPLAVSITGTSTIDMEAPVINMTGVVNVTGALNQLGGAASLISGTLGVTGIATFVDQIIASSSVDASYDLAEHVHLSDFATGPGDVDPPKDP